MRTRIAIVEDDPQVASSTVVLLDSSLRYELVWLAGTLAAARLRLDQAFDLLLLDLGLPDGRGASLIPVVRKTMPQALIVAFTVFDDESHVLEAIEAGVDGYALKNASAQLLLETLDSATRGESPISPAVAGFLLKRLRRSEKSAAAVATDAQARERGSDHLMELTPREREVLEMLARGLSYRDAGAALGIGANTVAHHVKNLYPKLAANSRSEAVFNALRDGVIRL